MGTISCINTKYVSMGNSLRKTSCSLICCKSKTCNKNGLSSPLISSKDEVLINSLNLIAFSFTQLKNATRNFHRDNLLREGRFGYYVFKGWIDKQTHVAARPGYGIAVAIKKLKLEVFQGHNKEWLLAEVNFLGQLHHPNLVKLIGYCIDGENMLLVDEFMQKGSLDNHLFRRGGLYQSLSWAQRVKVAIGAAKGLLFLHDAESQVLYRDFKAANILLDVDFNPKLSDFGIARGGPTSDNFSGTYGCAAPEYVTDARLSAKTDVYSFGVVLLELLSGRRLYDKSKVGVEKNLVHWANYLGGQHKFSLIMDPKLEGQYPKKGAYMVATLALQCICTDDHARPGMGEVLTVLEQIQTPKK